MPSGGAKRRSRAIANVPGEGPETLGRDDEENQTQITQITQKNADSPSATTVATLARQGLPVERFCEIREIAAICVRFSRSVPAEGPGLCRDDSDSSLTLGMTELPQSEDPCPPRNQRTTTHRSPSGSPPSPAGTTRTGGSAATTRPTAGQRRSCS